MNNFNKKHILIVSYDGICTHYCGVGTIIRNTIESLVDLAPKYDLKVSIAYISVNPSSKIFNQECYEESKNLTESTGGHLISLCNGTLGETEWDMWSRFEEWKATCASLATSINILLDEKEENIVMMHDTPFLYFQDFKKQIFDKSFRSYYLPHSSGINHNFDYDNRREERIENEKRLFSDILADPNSFLIAEGLNFAQHLINDYNVSFSKNDYLTNGLYFGRYEKHLRKETNYDDLKVFDLDFSKDSKIIFSWGRCSIAKGFRELALAWKDVHDKLPDHYLIIQSPDNSGENDYYKELKKYSEEIPRLIIINDYNPDIWKSFLRYKNTDVVVIPSVMDPNPHTAIEAKLFSKESDYIIVASNTDGVKDSYQDNECIYTNPYDTNDFSNALFRAIFLGESERNQMIEENRKNLINYDYKLKLESFLKSIKFI